VLLLLPLLLLLLLLFSPLLMPGAPLWLSYTSSTTMEA
jgi:hypothetical protein